MNKFILLALFFSLPLLAQDATPVITTDVSDGEEKPFNPRESHWLTSFGFEGMKYEVPFEYTGVEEKFKPSKHELWGGRIGVGGEMYLGAGIVTTTKIESYYMGTLFSRVLNAGPQEGDEDFAYTKRTGNIWGFEASQSLGFLFDMKTKNPFLDEWSYLTVEPYIEAGVGRAWAYNRINYDYDTGASGTDEGFRQKVRDDLVTTKVGGGINFTSRSGYFLYMKGTVNTLDITSRKLTTFEKADQGAGTTANSKDNDAKLDPVTVYAIGGGYKF